MTVELGFTGTQQGMTDKQQELLAVLLEEHARLWGIRDAHHGDCIGADEQFHNLVRRYKPDWKITIHPPIERRKRAGCEGDIILDPLPYLERNKNIVGASGFLYATPVTEKEVLRSGTWATIRAARRKGIPIAIVTRSGKIILEGF